MSDEFLDPSATSAESGAAGGVGRLRETPRWIWALAAIVLVFGVGLSVRSCDNDSPREQAATLAADGLEAVNRGNWTQARELYRKAAEKDPENVFAQYNLGLIAQTRDFDFKAAESFYRRTLEIDPEFGGALYNLAIVRTSAGARDEAIRLYRRAITAHPDFADAFLNLGLLLKDTPATADEAQSLLRRAAELDKTLEERVAPYLSSRSES